MRKVVQILTTGLVCLGTFSGTAAAQAASCSINGTGPGSNNTCTVNDTNLVTVTCVNGVTVTNISQQSAISGTATVNGNTISGTATSGDATNINTAATQLAQFCATPAAATPTTPVVAQTPAAGGQGAAAAPVQVKALPNTGKSNLLTQVGIAAFVLAAMAAAVQLALSAYRRSAASRV